MFSKKKKEDTKDRSKEPVKDGHKSDKSDKSDKDKHVAHSQSSNDTHNSHHHANKHKSDKKGKESDKEKDKGSTKAAASSKESLGGSTKSNKELKEHATSSKKFKKSSSAPVFIPKKGGLAEAPAVVDDELYDFLCDPTNCDDGPMLKFKGKAAPAKDSALGLKRAGSDKSTRSSRQSSSRSMSFS